MSAADDGKRARKRDALRRIATVQEILRRWDPIGVRPGESAPADEYDSYAAVIVTKVRQGCSFEQLCAHLRGVRSDSMGLEPDPGRDHETAIEILNALRGRDV